MSQKLLDKKLPNRDNGGISIQPIKLEFFIGGYMGNSYEVKMVDTEIHYQQLDQGYKASKLPELVTPTDQHWKAFRQPVDGAGVWDWKPKYSTPGVCDGTHWSLLLEYSERKISSAGDNAYPGRDEDPNDRDSPMDELLKALSQLLGGLPIH